MWRGLIVVALLFVLNGCTRHYTCTYVRADGSRYQEQWQRPLVDTWAADVRVVEKDQVLAIGHCEA